MSAITHFLLLSQCVRSRQFTISLTCDDMLDPVTRSQCLCVMAIQYIPYMWWYGESCDQKHEKIVKKRVVLLPFSSQLGVPHPVVRNYLSLSLLSTPHPKFSRYFPKLRLLLFKRYRDFQCLQLPIFFSLASVWGHGNSLYPLHVKICWILWPEASVCVSWQFNISLTCDDMVNPVTKSIRKL